MYTARLVARFTWAIYSPAGEFICYLESAPRVDELLAHLNRHTVTLVFKKTGVVYASFVNRAAADVAIELHQTHKLPMLKIVQSPESVQRWRLLDNQIRVLHNKE